MLSHEPDASRYRREQRPLALIGALCLLVGIQFFLMPSSVNRSALGHAVNGPADDIWSALFLVGGFGLIFGTQLPSPRIERAALIMLTAAIGLNFVAILAVVGVTVSAISYGLCLALFAERVLTLTRLDRRAAEGG